MGPKQQNKKDTCHEKDGKCDVKKANEKRNKKEQTNHAIHRRPEVEPQTTRSIYLPCAI